MFTLLPSLYLVAVHCLRRWNAPYYYEEEKTTFDTDYTNENNLIKTSNDIPSIELVSKCDNTLLQHNNELLITNQQSTRLNICENKEYLQKVNNDEDDQLNKVKLSPKKPTQSSSLLNVERQKTYTNDLIEDDIIYLMNETEFTREQILLWHSDFLVCKIYYINNRIHICFSYSSSAIVQMANSLNINLLIFINNFIRKVKLQNFANTPFVYLIKMAQVILVCRFISSIII